MDNLIDVMEKQRDIITTQADLILELYTLLAQYMTVEEMEKLGRLANIQICCWDNI